MGLKGYICVCVYLSGGLYSGGPARGLSAAGPVSVHRCTGGGRLAVSPLPVAVITPPLPPRTLVVRPPYLSFSRPLPWSGNRGARFPQNRSRRRWSPWCSSSLLFKGGPAVQCFYWSPGSSVECITLWSLCVSRCPMFVAGSLPLHHADGHLLCTSSRFFLSLHDRPGFV